MAIDTISAQCFIAVADTGSFTKAAGRVGRTQSAVSQQIAKLENFVGKPLFVRGKIFSLTSEGEIFLGYIRQIFALHREAIDCFKEPELKGEVRFGVPEDFASVFLYEVLREFSQMHPKILLNIECDLTLNLYEKFKHNELDLVIVKMSPPHEFRHEVELFSEKLEWAGDSRLVKKDEAIPLVLSPKPCLYREKAISALEKKKIKWRLAFSSNSYAGKIAAVRAGLGITIFPHTIIPAEIKIIRSKFLPKLKDSHFSLLKHKKDNAAVNSFEEFVIKNLK
ncbi:MAG: LysR family transcriptional regulator [Proteobacteria bacterium]|nr:LysR family transcriptional regulator [Pseudomonadota bacterium]